MALYEKTEKLFFEELGIAPSKEIIKRFRCMGERMSQAEAALDDIRQRLREKLQTGHIIAIIRAWCSGWI